jgi:hypothetical protein
MCIIQTTTVYGDECAESLLVAFHRRRDSQRSSRSRPYAMSFCPTDLFPSSLFRASHHSAQVEIELARQNIPFVKYDGLRFLEAAHAVYEFSFSEQIKLAAFIGSLLLAQSGHALVHCKCPLLEVKRTSCKPCASRFFGFTAAWYPAAWSLKSTDDAPNRQCADGRSRRTEGSVRPSTPRGLKPLGLAASLANPNRPRSRNCRTQSLATDALRLSRR